MDISKTVINSASSSSSGCWCIFVSLSDTEGVKFYNHPKIRDEAWLLQAAAADVGLAPAVGDMFDMPHLKSWGSVRPSKWTSTPETVYGYVTELVDVNEDADISTEEYEDCESLLIDHGISIRDISEYNNLGRTLDGTVVRYDFDPMFYYDEDSDGNNEWTQLAKKA